MVGEIKTDNTWKWTAIGMIVIAVAVFIVLERGSKF